MKPKRDDSSKGANLRQYVLAGIFGLMLLYFGGEWVIENLLQGPLEARRARTRRLEASIEKKEEAYERARAAGELLDRWERQSLPADTEVARSLYRTWLLELVKELELRNPSVSSSEPVRREGLYQSLTFSVRVQGTLEQLSAFLFVFYRTDLLHQIRSLIITPLQSADLLDLSMSIEAIALPSAGPSAQGATAEEYQETVFADFSRRAGRVSERLASDDFDAYRPIVERNLFGVGGSPDPADHAFLTSITLVDGRPQAWLMLRASDQMLRLYEGDSFRVGQLHGTIAEIAAPDVVLDLDGERWLLTLGESLSDAYALPPEF